MSGSDSFDPVRAERVRAIFDAVLEADPRDRTRVLAEACGSDAALRGEVEELLEASPAADEFLWSLAERVRALGIEGSLDLPEGMRRLGAYRILRRIGQGGMGAVYLAERDDARFEKQVAIKVLPPSLGAEGARQRFLTEQRLLARLEHPGIARLLDAGVAEDGTPFFVMEYVEGEPIGKYCERTGAGLEEKLDLFLQVCEAVEYAHEQQVIHRDLKPANILVTPSGRIKLLDFGIAKAIDDTALGGPTALTRLFGRPLTPAYASPEQLRGEGVTSATDVYALGVLLYELLTGSLPYQTRGLSPADLERLVRTRDPSLPSEAVRRSLAASADPRAVLSERRKLARRLRGDLDTIVLKALRPEPRRRYPTAADLAADLRRYRRGERVHARPDGWMYRAEKVVRRRPTASVAAALLLMMGGYAAGLAMLSADPPQQEVIAAPDLRRSIAVLPFATPGSPEPATFADGIHGEVLTRLSQIADLRVISRTSVLRYATSDEALPEIARSLGVGWIVEGEVREMGQRVHVSARLMDAAEDRQIWAESYLRELTAENLFDLQEEITTHIAGMLEARLTSNTERARTRAPTDDLEAYRSFLQGRRLLDQRTQREMERATEHFRAAIAHDPNYTLAWVGLADALMLLYDYGYAEGDEVLPEAEQAVAEALALDPNLAEAHASLGLTLAGQRNWPAALRQLRHSVQLRPAYADAHNWISWLSLLQGEPEEALQAARRAVELDPLSPEAVSNLALSYLALGDGERALLEARQGSEIQPDYTTPTFYEALALEQLGRAAEARDILDGLEAAWAGSGARSTLALMHIATGEHAAARELLAEFEAADDFLAAGLVHAALGDADRAFAALERVEEWGDWPTLAIRYAHRDVLASLAEDPRFASVLLRMNRYRGIQPPG